MKMMPADQFSAFIQRLRTDNAFRAQVASQGLAALESAGAPKVEEAVRSHIDAMVKNAVRDPACNGCAACAACVICEEINLGAGLAAAVGIVGVGG